MKKIINFTLISFVIYNTVAENDFPRFINFPDDKGNVHLIDLENDYIQQHKFDPDTDIKFFLYNRRNWENPVEFFLGNISSLIDAQFDPDKPMKISIHGWNGNIESPINTLLSDAFLNVMDVSVIAIDWGVGADADYISAVRYVPMIGAKVGQLIDWLNVMGASFTDLHIIGHSLGAHIAGISGRSISRGTADYISGLDPAFPLWGSDSERIRKTDGNYVEIMHTHGGQSGLMEPIGHTDFYPNGGVYQPGCNGIIDVKCHHNRAFYYMADSIDHEGFMADKCESLEEIKDGTCSNIGKLHMGGDKTKSEFEGVYYLETNAEKPFYKG